MNFETNLNKLTHSTIKQFLKNKGNISSDPVFNSYLDILTFVQRNTTTKDKTVLLG